MEGIGGWRFGQGHGLVAASRIDVAMAVFDVGETSVRVCVQPCTMLEYLRKVLEYRTVLYRMRHKIGHRHMHTRRHRVFGLT